MKKPAFQLKIEKPENCAQLERIWNAAFSNSIDDLRRRGPSVLDSCAAQQEQEHFLGRAPTKKFKQVDPPVKVTVKGGGFFDPPKHGTGAAANGIELHTVLNIAFDPDTDDCKTRAKPVS